MTIMRLHWAIYYGYVDYICIHVIFEGPYFCLGQYLKKTKVFTVLQIKLLRLTPILSGRQPVCKARNVGQNLWPILNPLLLIVVKCFQQISLFLIALTILYLQDLIFAKFYKISREKILNQNRDSNLGFLARRSTT